jgi:hypothetical protein
MLLPNAVVRLVARVQYLLRAGAIGALKKNSLAFAARLEMDRQKSMLAQTLKQESARQLLRYLSQLTSRTTGELLAHFLTQLKTLHLHQLRTQSLLLGMRARLQATT